MGVQVLSLIVDSRTRDPSGNCSPRKVFGSIPFDNLHPNSGCKTSVGLKQKSAGTVETIRIDIVLDLFDTFFGLSVELDELFY